VTLTGFRDVARPNVPITIGQIARVDFTLEIGTVAESVMVVGESPMLQTDKADVHTSLKAAELTNMPLNRYRNFQALLNLAPGHDADGVRQRGNRHAGALAGDQRQRPGEHQQLDAHRRRDEHEHLAAEPRDVRLAGRDHRYRGRVDQQLRRRAGHGGRRAVTGDHQVGHQPVQGLGVRGFNSDKLNAKPYFFGAGPAPDKLPVKTNNYGATLGGPIKRSKLFFFGSFEGYKRSQSIFTFFNVPDAALRAGDFSKSVQHDGSLQTIYNPFTGNPDGTGRQPFANNVIPRRMINPIALKILQMFPMPNTPGIGAGGYTNNYQRQGRSHGRPPELRREVQLEPHVRASALDQVQPHERRRRRPDELPRTDPNAAGDGGKTKVYQLTAGQTWTLEPVAPDGHRRSGSRGRSRTCSGPDFNAGNFGLDTLGIPGSNDQGIGDQRYAGYPEFRFGGTTSGFFSQLGNRDGWNPIFRDERTYSIAHNITKIKGQHDFRGGYFLNYLYLDHWQPETGNPRGRFDFLPNTTGLRGGPTANFYNAYASFLLGLVGQAQKSVQNELMTAREWQHALYFRDRWTPTAKLTLDLGLRWEAYPIMHRADGRGIDRLDLANPDFRRQLDVIIAGRGGNPQNNGMESSLNNFAPRLGGVYRINDATVFRSGYGLTYNAQPWARPMRGHNDYPVTIASTFVNAEAFAPNSTLQQGIPMILGPDLSSGRVPLDLAAGFYTPELGNIDRGYVHTWNIAVERMLPFDSTVEVAYVGAKGVGGYAGLDINAPQTLGVGDAGRPYASLGRLQPIYLWGDRLKTRYNSMQVALNKRMSHGFSFKGAYTLAKAMNEACNDGDGAATLCFNTPSELYRNWGPAGFDRRHNLQLGFIYSLPWQSTSGYGSFAKALASDWQLNGVFGAFSGNPFTMIANGGSLNTPSNNAGNTGNANLADLTARTTSTATSATRGRGSTRAPSRSRPASASATQRESVLRAGRLQPRPVGVPCVPDGRHEAARGRIEAGNIFNTACSPIRRTTSRRAPSA
jgi:hypothetical protein